MRSLMLLVLMAIATAGHAATLYKSVAPDGTVSYTDQPPATGKIEKTFEFANLPATPLPSSTALPGNQSGARAAPGGSEPQLFWAKWCPYCRQAEAYFSLPLLLDQRLLSLLGPST